jgi:hypothetical protein
MTVPTIIRKIAYLEYTDEILTKDSEGVLYSERLQIKPMASNVVLIEKQRYE